MARSEANRKERRRKRKARRRRRKGGSTGRSSKRSGHRPKSQTRQWLEAVLFALVFMLVLRTFFVDQFRIPSPSMEKTLLVGDYLFVSKLHYGPRLPMTLGVPYTDLYLHNVELPYVRLPGFDDVDRNDTIVFNYPPADQPIDRKVHYIKRVVGLPGETIEVRDKVVYADGAPVAMKETMEQDWTVYKKEGDRRISDARLESLGAKRVRPTRDAQRVRVQATPAAAEEIRSWSQVERVEPSISAGRPVYASLFPGNRGYTRDNYGPVTVPAEGQTVTLTEENWPVYRAVIDEYEERAARRLGPGRFEIDGLVTDTYTFRQDYFFAMGDNRDDSQDSRFWGFVPMDHVVGKAVMTYFSWESDAGWFGLPRFSRFFKTIE